MNQAFSIIPLTIEAKGEIITNNLPEFRELVREALGNINRELTTDEEFGQAELDIKALKAAEQSVRDAAAKSFDEQLKALVDGLNETAEEIRVPRLELEKLVAKRKEDVKSEIVEEYLAEFDIDPKDARKYFLAGLKGALSSKRTVESMRSACRVYQKTQQAMILKSRESIDKFVAKFGPEMVMDRRDLELENVESVEAELVRRVEAKRAADEQAKLRKEADDAKAEADKAKKALVEASKPTAQPEPDDAPWSGRETVAKAEESAAEEWNGWLEAVKEAFATLKGRRDSLKHPSNIEAAGYMSAPVNEGYKTMVAKRREMEANL